MKRTILTSILVTTVLCFLQLTLNLIGQIDAIDFRGQGVRDALMYFNLLNGIKDDDGGIDFVDGTDGFIAYDFKPNADSRSPYRLVLPEKLNEFAIISVFKPNTAAGGYLFSVVNPLDTIVQLGLHFSPKIKDKWNVTLLYADVTIDSFSRKLVSFEIPYAKKWTQIAFSVLNNKVTFFLNCVEMATVDVVREPLELVFDSASTLYLAQAGSIIKGHFEGIIEKLDIYGNPEALPMFCNKTGTTNDSNLFDDFGSGDLEDFEENDIFGGATDDGYDPNGGLSPPLPPPPPGGYRSGLKGEKGDRGLKGPPGDNIRGPPGPPGPPGPKGEPGPYPPYVDMGGDLFGSGKCSCNASEIIDVIKDNDMFRETIRGPPGMPGKEGKTGAPGLTGATGVPGERGAPGLKGDRGERGDPGARGPEGLQGQKGEPGIDGAPGLTGPAGPPGPPGLPENYDESVMLNNMANMRGNSPGPKGDTGEKGDIGRTGDRGQPGPKGDRGDPGMTGVKGDRGHPGVHGSSGIKGEQGSPGLPGLGGPPGANGNKGDRGLPGEIGPSGPPGPPGTVVYTDPRTNATECQCQAGPPGSPGVRGAPGFDGEPGSVGPPGPMGTTGLTGLNGPKGEKGPRGLSGQKGERGPEGPPGPAFFTAESTTTNGTKGEKGMRGRRGKPGSPGPVGPPGKPGPSGELGSTGHPGRPGVPGLKGEMGQKGQKGESGGKEGPKGDRGADGRDGKPGPPGLPAASGDGVQYVPMPGPPGNPGPPGPPGIPGISLHGAKGEPGDTRLPYYGDASFYGKPGGRSAFDEIKAIRELQHLKNQSDSASTSGPPGPPGPPGLSGSHRQQDDIPYSSSNMKIVPGAVTFQNTESMTKMSSLSPVGTIAYIIEEEALLVRVNKGWQYIALGSLLPIATPAPPTTIAPPPPRPDLQSSNLLNNIPQPVEGPNFTVSPQNEPPLRMAALNEPFYGDLQGIRGADFACYRQARRAGLLGTFKAFLSSRVQNLDSIVRLADHELPVVNTRGDILFYSWKGIFNGQGGYFSQAPRIYSFSGKNVLNDILWSQKIVWHGSMPNGERAMDTYCDAWHSSSPDKIGLASSLLGNKLLDQERYSCDNRFVVLCIEALSQDRRKKRALDERIDEFETAEEYAKHLHNILT